MHKKFEYLKSFDDIVKSKRTINQIHIHHSASTNDITAYDIDRWHRDKKWSEIGYQYVVLNNGLIQYGRHPDISPASASGHNANAIAICIVGNFDFKIPYGFEKQIRNTGLLIVKLQEVYDNCKIYFHKDLSNTRCPGREIPRDKFDEFIEHARNNYAEWIQDYIV